MKMAESSFEKGIEKLILKWIRRDTTDNMTKTKKQWILLLLSIPQLLWGAFTLLKMWAWFIVPLGVVQITLAHSIGLLFLLTGIKGIKEDERDYDEPLSKLAEPIKVALIGCTLILVFGYVTQLFM